MAAANYGYAGSNQAHLAPFPLASRVDLFACQDGSHRHRRKLKDIRAGQLRVG